MTAVDAQLSVALGFDALTPLRTGPTRASSESAPSAIAPRLLPALERRKLWERRYARRLGATDAAIVALTAAAGHAAAIALGQAATPPGWGALWLPALATAVWMLSLAVLHTREPAITGAGATEYRRVAHATGIAFGILAILCVVFRWDGLRMQFIVALPLGVFALLLGRWSWRRWLTRRRAFGLYSARTIVAGTRDDIEYVLRSLQKGGARGYVVLGIATVEGDTEDLVVGGRRYPIVGAADDVAAAARALGADSIVVASRPADRPDYIKTLSWQLEGTAAELILTNRLADVAGPRISLRPVDGLPLIHVKIPEFEGGKHALKRAMDVGVSAIALIPTGLVALVVGALITLDDHGPVFFRQTRIGRDGQEFGILKFRTMRTNAEAERAALDAANEGAGPLFKLRHDPRVTRVGAFLRRYSLDELPQFWNVLRGDMSIVGPRPPLPAEVTSYNGTVYRRLYLKPGITGLWQVSGRSDLSWEESVRLDLRYVENWSVMTDLMIMWRTAHVMVSRKGAY